MTSVCPGKKGLVALSACGLVPADPAAVVFCIVSFNKMAVAGFFQCIDDCDLDSRLSTLIIFGGRCGDSERDCSDLLAGHISLGRDRGDRGIRRDEGYI